MKIPGFLASAVLAAILLPAQVPPKGGTTTGPTGGSTTGTGPAGTTTTGTLPTAPGSTNATTNPNAGMNGPFFFGKVAMADGSEPPQGVVIERVCNGTPRPQAYTDSHGNFSFQVGQTKDMLPDASESSPSARGLSQASPKPNTMSSACDLRATLPGYRSDLISLSGRHNLDDPNIGTIFLRPYTKVEGLTISATSALAPKDARKAFDKGVEALKRSKIDEAENDFLKATDLYPRYASAWLELGGIYEQRAQAIEAREAYRRSIAADSKFVNPYERLYLLSFRENKWEDVARTTDTVMRLNPYDFPQAVYYNAVANSQLERLDVAEKSAREAIAIGSAAQNPKVVYILGVILAKKQDFKGSAECLRTYLKSDAVTDRDRVKQLLADVEKQVLVKAELKPEP
jgi:tetratricopeptide (TPR) repeat protein